MPFVNPQSHIFKNVYDNIFIQLDAVMTVACDDIITLNATLIGDLTNHTFLWEQLSGTPVTWLEAQNQQTVMFQQPATRDNKVFRFTLDAGMLIAKSREILVTAIPTDLIKTYVGMNPNIALSQSTVSVENVFSDMMPMFRPAGSVVLNDTQRSVLVTNSGVTGNAVNLVQFLNGEDILINTTSGFASSGSSILSGIDVDKTYKFVIDGLYESGSSSLRSYSSLYFDAEPDLGISDGDSLSTSVAFATGLSDVVETISRTVETVVTDDGEHTINTSVGFVTGLSDVVEIISRQLVINAESEDTLVSSVNFASGLESVVEVKAFQYSSLG